MDEVQIVHPITYMLIKRRIIGFFYIFVLQKPSFRKQRFRNWIFLNRVMYEIL